MRNSCTSLSGNLIKPPVVVCLFASEIRVWFTSVMSACARCVIVSVEMPSHTAPHLHDNLRCKSWAVIAMNCIYLGQLTEYETSSGPCWVVQGKGIIVQATARPFLNLVSLVD